MKLEEQLIKRMLRMACDAVLAMDKLAGYDDFTVQQKLIARYQIYFAIDWTEDLKQFAHSVVARRILECTKPSEKMFLMRCKSAWIPG